MTIFSNDLKTYCNALKRTVKDVPRYALGFSHTIKALSYADAVVDGRIERSELLTRSIENSLNDLMNSLENLSLIHI